MIWHIFKKDAQLLWPYAIAVAASQIVNAAILFLLGYFNKSSELTAISGFFPVVVFLGIVLLTIVVVQQDPLPGSGQDWLVRPVKRRDLLLAKALFVLVMIHLPLFILDVIEQLVYGFGLGISVVAALSREVTLFVTFSVPALLLGAITRSLAEAMIFGVMCAIGFTLLFPVGLVLGLAPFSIQSGTAWIALTGAYLVLMVCAAATLAFQYMLRRTLVARGMAVGSVLVALLALYVPFAPSFAVQQWVSDSLANENNISISFATGGNSTPSAPSLPASIWDGQTAQTANSKANKEPLNQTLAKISTSIQIPIRIAGLPRNSILLSDQITLRLVGNDGKRIYEDTKVCIRGENGIGLSCPRNTLEVRTIASSDVDPMVNQLLRLPVGTYNRVKDQQIRLELDYALTSFIPLPRQTISSTDAPHLMSGLGSCATQIDDDGDEVELHCLTSTTIPSCFTAMLEDPQTGLHNPEFHLCIGGYAPFPQNRYADVLSRIGFGAQFSDPSGLAHFPVDATRIQQAQLAITMYEPHDHFTRHLVIPEIRLSDWKTQSEESKIESDKS